MRVGLRRQMLAIAVGLALFAALGRPALWALVLSYAIGVLLLSLARAQEWLARPWRAVDWLLLATLIAPGMMALLRARAELIDDSGLHAITTLVADRVRLEALPAIAPPLVSADQPQSFFVHADAGKSVRVRFGARGKELAARELGEGLYRVDYDPRRDGKPIPSDGPIDVDIAVNAAHATRTLVAATPLAHPRWFALAPNRQLAATVSEETDELVIVSGRGLERRVTVGDGPTDCAFIAENVIAVTHRHDPALLIIEAGSGAKLGGVVLGPEQARLASSTDRAQLVVARAGRSPELVWIDLSSRSVRARLALATEPDWLAFGKDAQTIVYSSRSDASMHRVRVSSDGSAHEDAHLSLGRAAVTLGRANDGAQLYLAVTDYRAYPSGGGANLGNHFVQDQLLILDVARFAIVRAEPTARRTPRQSKPGDVDRGLSPMGIATTADGALLVTFAGSDELWRMRDGSAEPDVFDLSDAGLIAPHGTAELADGTLLVASPAAGAIGLVAPGQNRAQKPTLLRLAPDDDYLLAHNRAALERRLGEHGFYEATRSGISCQSCHMHADTDASAHNLGTHRALPTTSVRGVLGTAPYLRDGSFARIEDLDHVAQTLYRGYLRRVPGRAETLAAFVAALPRKQAMRKAEPAEDAAATTANTTTNTTTIDASVRRGLQAFVRGECTRCHAFPAFTNLGQQRARALFPAAQTRSADDILDTPSLLSLSRSAPYLSDGRARALANVLEQENRANRHGDSARLAPAERRDLIAFLESL